MSDQEFQDKQTQALCLLPPEFHAPLSYRAWETGHAYGHDEVLIHLKELADALLPAVRAYTARLKDEIAYANLESDRRF
jgi:hypothetical protein